MQTTTAADPQTARAQAQAFECRGELVEALTVYDTALKAFPDDRDLLAGLARLAGRMRIPGEALTLWGRLEALAPGELEAVDGRAQALRDLHRYGEAAEVLRAALQAHAADARLWNTFGTVANQQGDSDAALRFFSEAVRLDSGFVAAIYNRGGVLFDLGETVRAEADFTAAERLAAQPRDAAKIRFARGLLALHGGDLASGWAGYEARLDPAFPNAPEFKAAGRCWTSDEALVGAHLLVIGEQGIGDEIMFASLLPDVLTALGEAGRLSLAVAPRLVSLFQRSFPSAGVSGHASVQTFGRLERGAPDLGQDRPVELWAPIASLAQAFRTDIDTFQPPRAYLQPDAARVAHWRGWLEGQGITVGLSWRSGDLSGKRRRQYPPLADWTPLVGVDGVRFVNLQYDVREEELAELETLGAGAILRPPGLDLRNDLDDLAALCVALDLVVSIPNATAALAAACGAQVWFLDGASAWTRLGTQTYPWYAAARSFPIAGFGDWQPVMAQAAAALRARLAA